MKFGFLFAISFSIIFSSGFSIAALPQDKVLHCSCKPEDENCKFTTRSAFIFQKEKERKMKKGKFVETGKLIDGMRAEYFLVKNMEPYIEKAYINYRDISSDSETIEWKNWLKYENDETIVLEYSLNRKTLDLSSKYRELSDYSMVKEISNKKCEVTSIENYRDWVERAFKHARKVLKERTEGNKI